MIGGMRVSVWKYVALGLLISAALAVAGYAYLVLPY